jgi:hypothetical protein
VPKTRRGYDRATLQGAISEAMASPTSGSGVRLLAIKDLVGGQLERVRKKATGDGVAESGAYPSQPKVEA